MPTLGTVMDIETTQTAEDILFQLAESSLDSHPSASVQVAATRHRLCSCGCVRESGFKLRALCAGRGMILSMHCPSLSRVQNPVLEAVRSCCMLAEVVVSQEIGLIPPALAAPGAQGTRCFSSELTTSTRLHPLPLRFRVPDTILHPLRLTPWAHPCAFAKRKAPRHSEAPGRLQIHSASASTL